MVSDQTDLTMGMLEPVFLLVVMSSRFVVNEWLDVPSNWIVVAVALPSSQIEVALLEVVRATLSVRATSGAAIVPVGVDADQQGAEQYNCERFGHHWR